MQKTSAYERCKTAGLNNSGKEMPNSLKDEIWIRLYTVEAGYES